MPGPLAVGTPPSTVGLILGDRSRDRRRSAAVCSVRGDTPTPAGQGAGAGARGVSSHLSPATKRALSSGKPTCKASALAPPLAHSPSRKRRSGSSTGAARATTWPGAIRSADDAKRHIGHGHERQRPSSTIGHAGGGGRSSSHPARGGNERVLGTTPAASAAWPPPPSSRRPSRSVQPQAEDPTSRPPDRGGAAEIPCRHQRSGYLRRHAGDGDAPTAAGFLVEVIDLERYQLR